MAEPGLQAEVAGCRMPGPKDHPVVFVKQLDPPDAAKVGRQDRDRDVRFITGERGRASRLGGAVHHEDTGDAQLTVRRTEEIS